MSSRNESASSASRVFISAVLSPSSGSKSVRTAESPAVRIGGCGSSAEPPSTHADGLQQLSTVPHLQSTTRGGPVHGPSSSCSGAAPPAPAATKVSALAAISAAAPPAVRLVLVGLELGLAAHVDLVDDVPQHEVGLAGVDRLTPSSARHVRRSQTGPSSAAGSTTSPISSTSSRTAASRSALAVLHAPAGRVPEQDRPGRRRRGRSAGRRAGAPARPGRARAPGRPAGPAAGQSRVEQRPARRRSARRRAGRRAGRDGARRCAAATPRAATGRWRRGRRRAAPAAPRARARTPAGCRTGPRAARRRASRTRPTRGCPRTPGSSRVTASTMTRTADSPPAST